ncbi:cysteine--tRNA ligase [Sphingomonas sinipercae]|uniref:Cysteine--tRNA ligase n=1 Tax=Sphingomonas sinipercae TaxID=2714944 RepID=A0A6G7ZPH9_9SPHN|nr:cysteine--tRNA ligase [Sphingomonas sinipercae]QIL02843.1 cysteine--tRNA ligase [Sphingomonas sinipercae]
MIRLHDTMAREKREFVPADPGRITMYVCGPTVYGRAHIGNARPAVVFDTLARLIRHTFGQDSLVYARNVTDVDDKIIAAAEAEGVDPSVITNRFERFYLEDMGALGVQPPTIAPHATQEIGPMIAMIERLIETRNAYAAEGHVLFAVASDPDYGSLSRRDREQMIAGARVEVAPYKRDPADFVLWKPSGEGVIGWESPWGRGRPGWHIECSAMIRAHLGETIDIHGGGLDLIFPHHENEIAQSRCAHGGAPLARYWVHNGFVDMGAEKMSKSLGNVVTPNELLEQGHKGETLRLALLSAHYRSPLPWTEGLMAQSKSTLERLYRAAGNASPGEVDPGVAEALMDDLNTPLALSRLQALSDPATLKASASLLGLLGESADRWFQGPSVDADVEAQIAARAEAKANRDFSTADRIRDELKADGILLEDGPQGTTWRRA